MNVHGSCVMCNCPSLLLMKFLPITWPFSVLHTKLQPPNGFSLFELQPSHFFKYHSCLLLFTLHSQCSIYTLFLPRNASILQTIVYCASPCNATHSRSFCLGQQIYILVHTHLNWDLKYAIFPSFFFGPWIQVLLFLFLYTILVSLLCCFFLAAFVLVST